jgi:peptidoglycan/xylan/chitin deacetylase (PgdA/CDA1 family)
MFLHDDIKGSDLPLKRLCLTYDDGPGETMGAAPGPRTSALAEYLLDEDIEATFFVIGRHARQFPETLESLARCGHTIGNHTENHPGLVALAENHGDVVTELAAADALIRPFSRGQPIFFRPPYGNWRQIDPASGKDRPHSIVADILNYSGRFSNYIGPVNWDISAEDFSYWRRGHTAAEACAAYLKVITAVQRGIVLLHDSSDEATVRRNHRTLALTMLLVPELKERGYRFVPLRELPQVRQFLHPFSEGANDGCLRCTHDGSHDHAQSPRGSSSDACQVGGFA